MSTAWILPPEIVAHIEDLSVPALDVKRNEDTLFKLKAPPGTPVDPATLGPVTQAEGSFGTSDDLDSYGSGWDFDYYDVPEGDPHPTLDDVPADSVYNDTYTTEAYSATYPGLYSYVLDAPARVREYWMYFCYFHVDAAKVVPSFAAPEPNMVGQTAAGGAIKIDLADASYYINAPGAYEDANQISQLANLVLKFAYVPNDQCEPAEGENDPDQWQVTARPTEAWLASLELHSSYQWSKPAIDSPDTGIDNNSYQYYYWEDVGLSLPEALFIPENKLVNGQANIIAWWEWGPDGTKTPSAELTLHDVVVYDYTAANPFKVGMHNQTGGGRGGGDAAAGTWEMSLRDYSETAYWYATGAYDYARDANGDIIYDPVTYETSFVYFTAAWEANAAGEIWLGREGVVGNYPAPRPGVAPYYGYMPATISNFPDSGSGIVELSCEFSAISSDDFGMIVRFVNVYDPQTGYRAYVWVVSPTGMKISNFEDGVVPLVTFSQPFLAGDICRVRTTVDGWEVYNGTTLVGSGLWGALPSTQPYDDDGYTGAPWAMTINPDSRVRPLTKKAFDFNAGDVDASFDMSSCQYTVDATTAPTQTLSDGFYASIGLDMDGRAAEIAYGPLTTLVYASSTGPGTWIIDSEGYVPSPTVASSITVDMGSPHVLLSVISEAIYPGDATANGCGPMVRGKADGSGYWIGATGTYQNNESPIYYRDSAGVDTQVGLVPRGGYPGYDLELKVIGPTLQITPAYYETTLFTMTENLDGTRVGWASDGTPGQRWSGIGVETIPTLPVQFGQAIGYPKAFREKFFPDDEQDTWVFWLKLDMHNEDQFLWTGTRHPDWESFSPYNFYYGDQGNVPAINWETWAVMKRPDGKYVMINDDLIYETNYQMKYDWHFVEENLPQKGKNPRIGESTRPNGKQSGPESQIAVHRDAPVWIRIGLQSFGLEAYATKDWNMYSFRTAKIDVAEYTPRFWKWHPGDNHITRQFRGYVYDPAPMPKLEAPTDGMAFLTNFDLEGYSVFSRYGIIGYSEDVGPFFYGFTTPLDGDTRYYNGNDATDNIYSSAGQLGAGGTGPHFAIAQMQEAWTDQQDQFGENIGTKDVVVQVTKAGTTENLGAFIEPITGVQTGQNSNYFEWRVDFAVNSKLYPDSLFAQVSRYVPGGGNQRVYRMFEWDTVTQAVVREMTPLGALSYTAPVVSYDGTKIYFCRYDNNAPGGYSAPHWRVVTLDLATETETVSSYYTTINGFDQALSNGWLIGDSYSEGTFFFHPDTGKKINPLRTGASYTGRGTNETFIGADDQYVYFYRYNAHTEAYQYYLNATTNSTIAIGYGRRQMFAEIYRYDYTTLQLQGDGTVVRTKGPNLIVEGAPSTDTSGFKLEHIKPPDPTLNAYRPSDYSWHWETDKLDTLAVSTQGRGGGKSLKLVLDPQDPAHGSAWIQPDAFTVPVMTDPERAWAPAPRLPAGYGAIEATVWVKTLPGAPAAHATLEVYVGDYVNAQYGAYITKKVTTVEVTDQWTEVKATLDFTNGYYGNDNSVNARLRFTPDNPTVITRTDNFNRADADTPGTSYEQQGGVWGIRGNRLKPLSSEYPDFVNVTSLWHDTGTTGAQFIEFRHYAPTTGYDNGATSITMMLADSGVERAGQGDLELGYPLASISVAWHSVYGPQCVDSFDSSDNPYYEVVQAPAEAVNYPGGSAVWRAEHDGAGTVKLYQDGVLIREWFASKYGYPRGIKVGPRVGVYSTVEGGGEFDNLSHTFTDASGYDWYATDFSLHDVAKPAYTGAVDYLFNIEGMDWENNFRPQYVRAGQGSYANYYGYGEAVHSMEMLAAVFLGYPGHFDPSEMERVIARLAFNRFLGPNAGPNQYDIGQSRLGPSGTDTDIGFSRFGQPAIGQ